MSSSRCFSSQVAMVNASHRSSTERARCLRQAKASVRSADLPHGAQGDGICGRAARRGVEPSDDAHKGRRLGVIGSGSPATHTRPGTSRPGA